MFVHHRALVQTNSFRFVRSGEKAENPYGKFVTPTIVSWYIMKGDNISNSRPRKKFYTINYGGAHATPRRAIPLGVQPVQVHVLPRVPTEQRRGVQVTRASELRI
jgi:hypothetical protein